MTIARSRLGRLLAVVIAPIITLALLTISVEPALGLDRGDEREEDDEEARPGEAVVKLAAGADIAALNADYGTMTERVLLGSGGVYLVRTGGAVADDLVDQLSVDPRVVWAEPNYLGQVAEASPVFAWNDSTARVLGSSPAPWEQQDAVQRLGFPAAHRAGVGGGTRVAVLDTGVQAEHPAFAGRVRAGYDLVDDDAVAQDGANGLDDDGDGLVDEAAGHGTHVAGIVRLAAPGTTVLPYRVLDDDGVGDVVLVAEAIRMAVAAGADVLNSSFGTTADSELLDEVVEDAQEAGVVVVGAAGNDGRDRREYPGATEGAIAVGAVGVDDARAGFSNRGLWVTVAAPGESIPSAYPSDRFAAWSGTSMAAPFVAGQAAVLRGLAPEVGTEEIVDAIRSTASPLRDGSAPLIDVAGSAAALDIGSGSGSGSGSGDGDRDEGEGEGDEGEDEGEGDDDERDDGEDG